MKFFWILFLFALVLLGPAAPMLAQENAIQTPEEEEHISWEQKLLHANIYVSRFFDHMAEKLDLFLAQKKLTHRKNGTTIRVENSTSSAEGQTVTNVTHLVVNLQLPNVEEYWQVKFTSFDEAEERRATQQRGYVRQTTQDQRYGATVGVFRSLGNIKTSFQPRIELRDPLFVSHLIRFESQAQMKTYTLNPKLDLFATPDKGTGAYTALTVTIPMSPLYNFIVINDGEYQEKFNLFTSNSGFSIVNMINENNTLAYSVYFNSNNRPHYHLSGYTFSIAWSDIFYRKVLDYQIVPSLGFTEEGRFKGTAGLTFNLNLNF